MLTWSTTCGLEGVSAVLGAAERVAGEASSTRDGWDPVVGGRLEVLALESTRMRRPEGGPFFRRDGAAAGARARDGIIVVGPSVVDFMY
jgi:hypothetical protein